MHLLLCCCLPLLLAFDLSLATLQLFSSPNTNGSYCPGKVTFICVGTYEPIGVGWRINGSIIYTYTFQNVGDEDFPEVVFGNGIFNITVKDAVVIPPGTHNITIELSGNVSNLLQSTVSCRTALEESNSFFILPADPEIPNINVAPVYDFSTKTLSQINVSLNVMNGFCMEYSYQVMLTDGSSILRSENVNCQKDTKCQVTFMIMSQMFDRYIIDVVTLDFQGLAVNTSSLPPIDRVSSFLPNITVEFVPCFIRCYSDPNLNGTCEIEFPDVSVSGTVNSEDIQIPKTLQSGIVNYSATFNIDGMIYKSQNSSDVQYINKWTTGILICVILTPILCFLSFILIILIGVGLLKKKDHFMKYSGYKVIIACTILPSIIFLLVSLCCWIAGLVDVSKTDNCSSVDQPQSILIAACIFSFLSVIFDVAAIALVHICDPQKNGKHTQQSNLNEPESWQNQEEVRKWKTDKFGMLVDEHGDKVVEGHLVESGHRAIGEKMSEARIRVQEQRTRDVKKLIAAESAIDSNVYSQTEHVGPSSNQKKKPKPGSNYSNMGRKPAVSPGDGHYRKLQHNDSASVTSGAHSPDVFTTTTTTTATTSSGLSSQSIADYSHVGTQLSELSPNNRVNAEKNGSGSEYSKLEDQEGSGKKKEQKRKKHEETGKRDEDGTVSEA